MASQAKKKTGSSAGRNPDRRNGKAWKKDKPNRVKTPERLAKDQMIEELRLRRKEANLAKQAIEKQLKEKQEEENRVLRQKILEENRAKQLLKDWDEAIAIDKLMSLPKSMRWVGKQKITV